jgi:putative phosphoribosyl transferase
MVFRDRTDAGIQLGLALKAALSTQADMALAEGLAKELTSRTIVLAIPRGGVIVGAEVARALGAPLDVVIPRKLGAPGNPELGVGAVAPGVRVIDAATTRALGVTDEYLEGEARRQLAEIERRTLAYRGGRPPADLHGATAIVVDDGVATGVTAIASLRWARAQGARVTIFAAPVGPNGIEERFAGECDRCIVLQTPRNLRAVGQWYDMFDQTTDVEVREALDVHAP